MNFSISFATRRSPVRSGLIHQSLLTFPSANSAFSVAKLVCLSGVGVSPSARHALCMAGYVPIFQTTVGFRGHLLNACNSLRTCSIRNLFFPLHFDGSKMGTRELFTVS